MRKVCLVNSFNYARFLSECLSSIERQTVPFDVVVVVDDGSSDGSQDIVRSYCDRLPGWTAVLKSNGGQLSCFNASLPYIEDDDLVTFIDSDDVYPADYLAVLSERALTLKADFYFSDVVEFENGRAQPIVSAHLAEAHDVKVESSSALTRRLQLWMGSPTTALAVSGRLFRQLLPYPHEADWVTRADDVLVFGASLLGASKAYLPSVRVAYRVHGNNDFHGRRYGEAYHLRRQHKLEKLFGWYCERQSIARDVGTKRVMREYALVPQAVRQRLQLPDPGRFLKPAERVSLWWRIRRQARQQA